MKIVCMLVFTRAYRIVVLLDLASIAAARNMGSGPMRITI